MHPGELFDFEIPWFVLVLELKREVRAYLYNGLTIHNASSSGVLVLHYLVKHYFLDVVCEFH